METPNFKGNIEDLTVRNKFYRKVIHTNPRQQLVLMNIQPREEIGEEVHRHTSQFIRVEEGQGVAYIDGEKYLLKDGDALVIPPGAVHNIINTSKVNELKIYTIYSPPEHPFGKVQRHKN